MQCVSTAIYKRLTSKHRQSVRSVRISSATDKQPIIIIIIIIIIIGLFQSHSEDIRATYQETMKSWNYRKQPYWALHTYSGKY